MHPAIPPLVVYASGVVLFVALCATAAVRGGGGWRSPKAAAIGIVVISLLWPVLLAFLLRQLIDDHL